MTGTGRDGRIDALQRRAWSLLGAAGAPVPRHRAGTGDEADATLAVARERLEAQIGEDPGAWPADDLVDACRTLDAIDRLQREREQDEVRRRLAELRRLQESVAALRELAPAEAIDRAPEELCRSCSFGRGMISSVVASMWLPRRLHIVEGSDEHADEFQAFVQGARIPLSHTLVETDLVRRRMPALISDPGQDGRTFKAIVAASRSSSYVVAPIMSRGRAIGFLHADRRDGDKSVTDVDRDRIAAFASCFGLVYEQSLLRSRLQGQTARARATFAATESALSRLESSPLELDEAVAVAAAAHGPRREPDDPSALPRVALVLTAREREVLALMSTGATNTQIAEQLVIADGTVKSHVKHILRKLRAPTRAAAVARYAHLSGRVAQSV